MLINPPEGCRKIPGFKIEDELKSGLKSSCRSYEALMHMSATDYCHVSFALELIMLRTDTKRRYLMP